MMIYLVVLYDHVKTKSNWIFFMTCPYFVSHGHLVPVQNKMRTRGNMTYLDNLISSGMTHGHHTAHSLFDPESEEV